MVAIYSPLLCILLWIAGVSAQTFTVSSGGCDTSGDCVRSPNFPNQDYSNSQTCNIVVNTAGYLTDTFFETESGFDTLVIGSQTYSGNVGPNALSVSAGQTIQWSADASFSLRGWQVCFSASLGGSAGTRRRTFAALQTALSAFTVNSGSCVASGDCVRSPNFPSLYGASQSCSIDVNIEGYLADTYFVTERSHDKLTISRRRVVLSGSPNSRRRVGEVYGVSSSPGHTMSWSSDWSIQYIGFQICATDSLVEAMSRRRSSAVVASSLAASTGSCKPCCIGTSCSYHSTTCTGTETKSDCWCTPTGGTSVCYASSSSACCDSNTAVVAAIVIGCIVTFLVLLCLCCYCCRRQQKQRNAANAEMLQQPTVVVPPLPVYTSSPTSHGPPLPEYTSHGPPPPPPPPPPDNNGLPTYTDSTENSMMA